MKEPLCQSCEHFIQHYGIMEDRIFTINCGHCAVPRRRHRQALSKACVHYKPGNPGPSSFADKKYLSKKLVEYVLSMDLLPDIEAEIRELK